MLGFPILYFKSMRLMMFQLSGEIRPCARVAVRVSFWILLQVGAFLGQMCVCVCGGGGGAPYLEAFLT